MENVHDVRDVVQCEELLCLHFTVLSQQKSILCSHTIKQKVMTCSENDGFVRHGCQRMDISSGPTSSEGLVANNMCFSFCHDVAILSSSFLCYSFAAL